MEKLVSLFLCIFFLLNVKAQNGNSFEVRIQNLPNTMVYLYNYEGDRNQLLDSTSTDQTGYLKLFLKPNWKPGLYKIEIGIDIGQRRPYFFNFIYNAEDISLITAMPDLGMNMDVLYSIENQIYYDFNKLNDKRMSQLVALFELKRAFSAEDPFYSTIKKEYEFQTSDEIIKEYLIDDEREFEVDDCGYLV